MNVTQQMKMIRESDFISMIVGGEGTRKRIALLAEITIESYAEAYSCLDPTATGFDAHGRVKTGTILLDQRAPNEGK